VRPVDVWFSARRKVPKSNPIKTFHELQVVPKAGKAVLFYSQLPDGNMDDFSQHAAKPIVDGEKWLSKFKMVECCKTNTLILV